VTITIFTYLWLGIFGLIVMVITDRSIRQDVIIWLDTTFQVYMIITMYPVITAWVFLFQPMWKYYKNRRDFLDNFANGPKL